MKPEELILAMLMELRHLRNADSDLEMRRYYNEAADRLDVLVSKLTNQRLTSTVCTIEPGTVLKNGDTVEIRMLDPSPWNRIKCWVTLSPSPTKIERFKV